MVQQNQRVEFQTTRLLQQILSRVGYTKACPQINNLQHDELELKLSIYFLHENVILVMYLQMDITYVCYAYAENYHNYYPLHMQRNNPRIFEKMAKHFDSSISRLQLH